MRRRATTKEGSGLELNLTPMIDVMFLLLIFFVCQLRFRLLDGRLDAYLPRDAGSIRTEESPLEGLRIRLTRGAGETTVAVNGRPLEAILSTGSSAAIPLLRVERALREFRERWPDLPADLDPDAAVPTGHVVAVLDAAIAAGLPSIRFTSPR